MLSRTRWKDWCAAAHACTWRRQTRQLQRLLATGGATPSGNGIRTRFYNACSRPARPRCASGGKTRITDLRQSVRDARTQIHTGHQDIRAHFSEATVAANAVVARTATAATATATRTDRPDTLLLDNRQRFLSARIRMAALLLDIRQFFPVATAPRKAIGGVIAAVS